jgi:GNAT superfamily N-acetyltransferase
MTHEANTTTGTVPEGLTLRGYREGDEAALYELLTQSYERWPAVRISVDPLEHMRWKMRLEETEERLHKIAEVDGRMVGATMGWTREALLKGQTVLTGDGSDACVHPDYRGRGVMKAMRFYHSERRQRYPFLVVGGTVHPAMIELRKYRFHEHRANFQNRIERFVRPLTLREAARTFRVDSRAAPRKFARRMWRLAAWLAARGRQRVGRTADSSITVRSVETFDERVDALCEEAARPFDFMLKRDREFLTWRYDRRGGDFTIEIAEDAGELAGYAVLCTDIERERGYIADMLALPDRDDVTQALVTAALAWGRRAGLKTLVCWLPERHPYRHVLDGSDFVLRRLKTTMGYRAPGTAMPAEELTFLEAPDARIHLMLGDTDTV